MLHITSKAAAAPRLIEFCEPADALCLEELDRLPTHTAADPVAEVIKLRALQGQTGPETRAWLREQPEAVAFRMRHA